MQGCFNMGRSTISSLLCLACLCILPSIRSSPCYTIQPGVVYYSERICSCHRWWPWSRHCVHHRYVTRSYYTNIKRCCPGYIGTDCATPVCRCQNGGTCIAPNVCKCPFGYGGNSCQNPLCNPRCVNGYCSAPNRCTCFQGYTGFDCTKPVCDPECSHGGSCKSPNYCLCSNSYTGPQCNKAVCRPPCLNGGTCQSPGNCACVQQQYTGSQCETPVCDPPCENNGKCVSPGKCSCLQTYTGGHCETPLCSYHSPCFPGSCNDSVNCRCKDGFGGINGFQRCKKLATHNTPVITKSSAYLANIERTGEKKELYRFMTDSSEPNSSYVDMLWLSEKDYNYVNADFTAIYVPVDEYELPDYVLNYTFGIVRGKMQLDLYKVDRQDPNNPFISMNRSLYDCPNQPGSATPNTGVFSCSVTNKDFDRLLEDGDNLTLTVIAENGGYRKLKTPTNTLDDFFIGRTSQKSMMFRFDFRKPRHCLLDGPCVSKAFTVTDDVTKNPIEFVWDGWTDALSGIGKYKIEEYLLEPNQNVNQNLTEPDPWSPLNTFTFPESSRNYTRTPDKPGMYSFILNVVDKANNTQYARTLVLYDNTSSIMTDDSSPMIVTSAAEETSYQWQNNLTNDITVSWKNHFTNLLHETHKFLVPVTIFKYHNFYVNFQKAVPDKLEDQDGKRTFKGIKNVRGIVKFKYAYRHGNLGEQPPSDWHEITNVLTQRASFYIPRQNGDSLNIWVKATDILGNEKIDIRRVYFDETPPEGVKDVDFIKNLENSTFDFSSRLAVETQDVDSGIHRIYYNFTSNLTGSVFKTGYIPGNKSERVLTLREGYKDRMGEYFYYRHNLDINNCWMVVSKDVFKKEAVNLELTIYNRAMESTSFKKTLTDLESLNGIDEYTGPTNLHVDHTYANGVRLRWTVSPTCYERSRIVVVGVANDGQTFTWLVDKDADHFDVTGLDPETAYNLSLVTEYGAQKSDPHFVPFTTIAAPSALTAGGIAGISIVMIILLSIIIVGVIMWRTGRLSVAKQGIQRRMTVVRERIQNRYTNIYEDQDDIYLYGQMEVNKSDSWIIPHSAVVLDSLLTNGKFADIYRIRYQDKKSRSEFVAKVLRSGFTAEDQMSMRAKINFYASKVGDHPNILHFAGAVLDDETLGPYMVLEFCEIGQLNIWLQKQINSVNEETSEQLCRIAYGICKGMSHLENKKLVHRRLAARNVLLTSDLEPKIYGFCPQQQTTEGESKDEDGDAKEDKSRIPVKWTAPECLLTMKNATPKSDAWSFGIVLWEIFSFGEVPYPGIRSRDVQEYLKCGNRMDKPEFADNFYYNLMKRCWTTKPKQRSSFCDMTADIGKTFNSTPSDDFYYYSRQ